MTLADRLLTCDDLAAMIDSGVQPTVLDVRTAAEFETAKIADSVNIPLDQLHGCAADIARTKTPLVLACKSGRRSTEAFELLAAHGADLTMLDGGLDAWESSAAPMIRGESKWAMDRQVRFTAGSIALAGVLASIVVPKAKWAAGGVASGLVWSAVSDTCAMATALGRLPYNRGAATDLDTTIGDIARRGRHNVSDSEAPS